MDRAYIEKHNVIERYLLGELSEEEAEAFEDRFVFDQELRDEIDVAEKMIGGLRRQEVEPQAAVAGEPQEPASSQGFRWAIAAALVGVAILVPYLYFSTPGTQRPDLLPPFELSATQPDTASAALVMLGQVRSGTSTSATGVPLYPGPDAVVVLGIPVSEAAVSGLTVSVSRESGEEVWSGTWPGDVAAGELLYLTIPSSWLSTEEYSLSVGGETYRFLPRLMSAGAEE